MPEGSTSCLASSTPTSTASARLTRALHDATRSAAAGGVTTIIEMPYDQGRPVMSSDVFLDKRERLEAQSVVDVALLATIKKTGGLDQIPLMAEAGACGIKVSLYETDPNRFPRIPDAELLEHFAWYAKRGCPSACTARTTSW